MRFRPQVRALTEILAEYERVLTIRGSVGRRFFERAMKIGNFVKGSGQPQSRCRSCLIAEKFDPADRPYIGVAQRFSGIYITHENKHLIGRIQALAPTECGMVICDLITARTSCSRMPADSPRIAKCVGRAHAALGVLAERGRRPCRRRPDHGKLCILNCWSRTCGVLPRSPVSLGPRSSADH